MAFGSSVGFSAGPCISCEDLADVAFGPEVTIYSATLVDEGLESEHCVVEGAFLPEEDPFMVKLPTEWNGNYYQEGNGGLAGNLPSLDYGLARGYAVAGASGGYDGTDPINMNGKFGYDPGDGTNDYAEQKLDGLCFASVHKMNVLGKKIVKAYYCQKALYAYYKGCSQGGRQGMIEAQRYPDDFDGIMAGAPPVYFTKVTMRDVWQAQKVVVLPWSPLETNTMMAIVSQAVYQKCDSMDGLVDGIIDDPRQCTFNALTDLPSCEDGVTPCLTAAQRTAIQKIYDGPRNSVGELLFKGTPYGGEAIAPGFFGPASGWLGMIIPFVPGTLSIGGSLGSGFTQYCSLPPDRGGPGWDYMTFDWDDDWPYVMEKMSARCDANDPDLRAFRKKGGKLIQYHGWADPLVSPYAMATYYDQVLRFMGEKRTKEFYRLYMIPGLGHCGGGLGCSNDDGFFNALVDWVENGVEPYEIIGSRAAYPPLGLTARTRPMCPYPEVARYLGEGSIDDAANFACVTVIPAKVHMPETLNLPRDESFEALITFPHGYYPGKGWDIIAVVCEGAPTGELTKFTLHGKLKQKGNTYIAEFNSQDLIGIPAGEVVTFTVTVICEHRWHKGQQVAFEGSDTVSVYLASE
jgi:feruloyl esterase